MGITEHGKFVLNIMKENGLLNYYDTLSGNCCFSKEEYDDNISSSELPTAKAVGFSLNSSNELSINELSP